MLESTKRVVLYDREEKMYVAEISDEGAEGYLEDNEDAYIVCELMYIDNDGEGDVLVLMEENIALDMEGLAFVTETAEELYEFINRFIPEVWAESIINRYEEQILDIFDNEFDGTVVVRTYDGVGAAVCNGADNFDFDIGLAVALCRIYGREIPSEL